jgi:hypothetical protein
MKNRSNQKSAPRAPKSVETPAVVIETPAVVIETPAIETPAPVVETPAPVVAETPAKVSWGDTMKKAQASFAKTGAFREGTNRHILYPLLDRPEGITLDEAAKATLARGGKARGLSSIHTDLHDIAKITQRKLVRADKGDQKRYRLADVPAPVVAETEKEEVK